MALQEASNLVSTSEVFLTDFFRHRFGSRSMRVFLCGHEPESRFRDPRHILKRILEDRFGCEGFLGEEIPEIAPGSTRPSVSQDHLTIEVGWAEKSDLIIMFLGSPGTFAELTAFALTKTVNPKLLVFNLEKFRSAKSFISLGPLKLLKSEQRQYYKDDSSLLGERSIRSIDAAVSRAWHRRYYSRHTDIMGSYYELMVLCLVYALFPVAYSELKARTPWSERVLLNALKSLNASGLVAKSGPAFEPKLKLESCGLPTDMQSDLSAARARSLSRLIVDDEFLHRYERKYKGLRGAGRFRTAF